MTLNEECVRDVLIYCKNNIDYRELQDGSFSLIPVTFKQLLASMNLCPTYVISFIKQSLIYGEALGFLLEILINPISSSFMTVYIISLLLYV